MNGTGIRQFIPNAARPQILGGFCRAASGFIARTNFSNTRAVTIADRGPSTRGRIIDLSVGAAHKLGFHGLARVRLRKV